jgi:cephalosporin-C deacetylase-like acetyl esterase
MRKTVISSLFTLVVIFTVQAQTVRSLVNVVISPSHDDWTYKIGESAGFEIYVLRNSVKLKDITLNYEYGPEKQTPVKKGTLELKTGVATLNVPGMKNPGFQTVKVTALVDGVTYSNYTTIGYEPDKIQPTTTLPDDFLEFWDSEKAKAGKLPLKPVMTLIPDRCTDKTDVYHVEYQNETSSSFMYGILCVPKAPGQYPGILKVPGAGVRPYYGDVALADKGVIVFEIGIHGIPVNLSDIVYERLRGGALSNYMFSNLDNRNTYYYKRVYIGCTRAVDFMYTLEKLDKSRLAVMGGSQGGALSIITAALDGRIKFLAPTYPALCDLTGYLHGRAGGWPHMFLNSQEPALKEKEETSKYYDVVNFARFVKVPGYYSWGYNDPTCPPTSTYSAYNVITAEKELHIFLETGHWTFPEERAASETWILKKLNVN